MKKNQKILLCILLTIMLSGSSCMNIFASIVIPVNNKSCKYTVSIPQGWDTIPHSFLQERLKQFNVDLGIYPVSQAEYTDGNYALICFMPTMQPLNAFTFKQIATDVAKSNEMSELKTDTLQIHFNKMDTEIRDGKYFIYSNYSIVKDTIPFENWQMLYLTKFGYVSVLFYAKENGAVSIDKAPTLFSEAITIQSDYQYKEYEKKSISLKHILLSLAIGLVVYVLVAAISKKRK